MDYNELYKKYLKYKNKYLESKGGKIGRDTKINPIHLDEVNHLDFSKLYIMESEEKLNNLFKNSEPYRLASWWNGEDSYEKRDDIIIGEFDFDSSKWSKIQINEKEKKNNPYIKVNDSEKYEKDLLINGVAQIGLLERYKDGKRIYLLGDTHGTGKHIKNETFLSDFLKEISKENKIHVLIEYDFIGKNNKFKIKYEINSDDKKFEYTVIENDSHQLLIRKFMSLDGKIQEHVYDIKDQTKKLNIIDVKKIINETERKEDKYFDMTKFLHENLSIIDGGHGNLLSEPDMYIIRRHLIESNNKNLLVHDIDLRKPYGNSILIMLNNLLLSKTYDFNNLDYNKTNINYVNRWNINTSITHIESIFVNINNKPSYKIFEGNEQLYFIEKPNNINLKIENEYKFPNNNVLLKQLKKINFKDQKIILKITTRIITNISFNKIFLFYMKRKFTNNKNYDKLNLECLFTLFIIYLQKKENLHLALYAYLMDINTLIRLSKKYMNNIILISGNAHSRNIQYYLKKMGYTVPQNNINMNPYEKNHINQIYELIRRLPFELNFMNYTIKYSFTKKFNKEFYNFLIKQKFQDLKINETIKEQILNNEILFKYKNMNSLYQDTVSETEHKNILFISNIIHNKINYSKIIESNEIYLDFLNIFMKENNIFDELEHIIVFNSPYDFKKMIVFFILDNIDDGFENFIIKEAPYLKTFFDDYNVPNDYYYNNYKLNDLLNIFNKLPIYINNYYKNKDEDTFNIICDNFYDIKKKLYSGQRSGENVYSLELYKKFYNCFSIEVYRNNPINVQKIIYTSIQKKIFNMIDNGTNITNINYNKLRGKYIKKNIDIIKEIIGQIDQDNDFFITFFIKGIFDKYNNNESIYSIKKKIGDLSLLNYNKRYKLLDKLIIEHFYNIKKRPKKKTMKSANPFSPNTTLTFNIKYHNMDEKYRIPIYIDYYQLFKIYNNIFDIDLRMSSDYPIFRLINNNGIFISNNNLEIYNNGNLDLYINDEYDSLFTGALSNILDSFNKEDYEQSKKILKNNNSINLKGYPINLF